MAQTKIHSPGLGVYTSSNEDGELVNDLFSRLQISDIRSLLRDYTLRRDEARVKLHALVSNKYRDLVKIAEDIDKVHTVSTEIDSSLASLSYRLAYIVPFSETHALAKFDAQVRSATAAQDRQQSMVPALNLILLTRLTKLDLKISATNNGLRLCPFSHTCYLVYYAQVYFTIETVFANELQDDCFLRTRFQQLKDRFVEYIESQLAKHNASLPLLFSRFNDKFLSKHVASLELFITGAGIAMDEFDDLDDLDVEVDDDDDEDQEDQDDDGNLEKISRNGSRESLSEYRRDDSLRCRLRKYNTGVPSIVNYLLVFIILCHNHKNYNTLAKVAERFLFLRQSFAQSLLGKVESSADFNFFAYFKYVENTHQFVDRYFCQPHSDLIVQLQAYTKPWMPADVLGLHLWLPSSPVMFNQDMYCIELPPLVLAALNSSLQEFSSNTLRFCGETFSKLDSLTPKSVVDSSLKMYYHFTLALAKLHRMYSQHDSESMLLKNLSTLPAENSLSEHLSTVGRQIECAFAQLFGSLVAQAEFALLLPQNDDDEHVFFSDAMVNEMDDDMPSYISRAAQSSLGEGKYGICKFVLEWFADSMSAIGECDTRLNNNNNDNNLTKIFEVLSASHNDDNDDKHEFSCGLFSASLVSAFFEQFDKKIKKDMRDTLGEFIALLKSVTESATASDMRSQYHLLSVVITIDQQLVAFGIMDSGLDQDLQLLAGQIYDNITVHVPRLLTFEEGFATYMESDLVSQDMYDRPTLRLSFIIEQLAEAFLRGHHCGRHCTQMAGLFIHDRFTTLFADAKNKMLENYSKQLLEHWTDAKNSEDNLLQILADLLYLAILGGNQALDKDRIRQWSVHISPEVSIEDEQLEKIVTGVASFCNNTRHITFPIQN